MKWEKCVFQKNKNFKNAIKKNGQNARAILMLKNLLPLIEGIWYSIIVAEVAACIVTAIIFVRNRKKYRYA